MANNWRILKSDVYHNVNIMSRTIFAGKQEAQTRESLVGRTDKRLAGCLGECACDSRIVIVLILSAAPSLDWLNPQTSNTKDLTAGVQDAA